MIKFSNDDIKYLAIELPDSVKNYKYAGDFRGELRELERLLRSDRLPHALEERLILEQVIATGMCHDYTTDLDGLLARISAVHPACDAAALDRLLERGHADFILRNGQKYFQNSAAANLLNCHDTDLRRLADPDHSPTSTDGEREAVAARMRSNGSAAWRFTVCEELWVAEGAERPGETIRVHLPFPAPCQSQPADEIKLVSCSHPDFYISNAAQRTVCITAPYHPGERFSITFSYVNRAPYRDLTVAPAAGNRAATEPFPPADYLGEQYPHVRFTPFINELALEIAGDERDPLALARRVYDWVTANVKYSYMREYLYIENIPEFAALNGRGDCGVMALLFITLCRRLGIPAKWESGSQVRPGSIGSHDWAMFYVEPYGWLYADPSYGEGARRRGCERLWEHYFGNLDPFRLVANNDFQCSFDPPKRYMRTDPYDSQSGEAEYETYGLGFGELRKARHVVAAEEL